jgi:hypothetical protein
MCYPGFGGPSVCPSPPVSGVVYVPKRVPLPQDRSFGDFFVQPKQWMGWMCIRLCTAVVRFKNKGKAYHVLVAIDGIVLRWCSGEGGCPGYCIQTPSGMDEPWFLLRRGRFAKCKPKESPFWCCLIAQALSASLTELRTVTWSSAKRGF